MAIRTKKLEKMALRGVLAPPLKLTAEREKEPRTGITGKEPSRQIGQTLSHKLLIAVQALARLRCNRTSNGSRFNQGDGRHGQGAGRQFSNEIQIRQRQISQRRQASGQFPNHRNSFLISSREEDNQRGHHHADKSSRQFRIHSSKDHDHHDGGDTQAGSKEMSLQHMIGQSLQGLHQAAA